MSPEGLEASVLCLREATHHVRSPTTLRPSHCEKPKPAMLNTYVENWGSPGNRCSYFTAGHQDHLFSYVSGAILEVDPLPHSSLLSWCHMEHQWSVHSFLRVAEIRKDKVVDFTETYSFGVLEAGSLESSSLKDMLPLQAWGETLSLSTSGSPGQSLACSTSLQTLTPYSHGCLPSVSGPRDPFSYKETSHWVRDHLNELTLTLLCL